MLVYHFVDPGLKVEIIFREEGTAENGGIDFEIGGIGTSAHWYLSLSLYLFLPPLGGQNIIWIFSNLRVSAF